MQLKRQVLNITGIVLGVVFIFYGTVKLLGSQFIFAHDWVIDGATTDGPTLVWCFFGYSSVYGRLIGLGELVPGVLLLIPRTRLLGALILLPVTANITLMDFCFDFPAVKYFALMLTLGCTLLVAGEWGKFKQAMSLLLVRQTDPYPSPYAPELRSRWRMLWVFPGFILALLLVHQLAAALSAGPAQTGYAACVEHGWKRGQLKMVRWQTDSWSGFNSSGFVEIQAGKGEEAKMIRVNVWRPCAFLSWQAVDYAEALAQTPPSIR
jgi:hypothetical protein